jgi:hypothetical protein
VFKNQFGFEYRKKREKRKKKKVRQADPPSGGKKVRQNYKIVDFSPVFYLCSKAPIIIWALSYLNV